MRRRNFVSWLKDSGINPKNESQELDLEFGSIIGTMPSGRLSVKFLLKRGGAEIMVYSKEMKLIAS